MTTPVIIDLIAAGVLLGFGIAGARRGLFRTLAGLLIVVLAMAGARYAAELAVEPAAEFLAPAVERRIQKQLDETLPSASELTDGVLAPDVEDLLGLLNIREARLTELAERARAYIRDTGAPVLTAAAMSVVEPALYGLFYALAFTVLSVGLSLLARTMDLMLKLPVLHSANALCGGLAGALEGSLIVLIGALLLQGLGVPLEGSCLGWMMDIAHPA